jgi:hypothetical protein
MPNTGVRSMAGDPLSDIITTSQTVKLDRIVQCHALLRPAGRALHLCAPARLFAII